MSHILEDPAIYRAMVAVNDETQGTERYFELIRITVPLFRDAVVAMSDIAKNDITYVDVPYYGRTVRAAVIYKREGHTVNGVWYSHYDFLVILDPTVPASQAVYARIVERGDAVMFEPCLPPHLRRLPVDWVRSIWGGMGVTGGRRFEVLMSACQSDPAGTLRKYREEQQALRR